MDYLLLVNGLGYVALAVMALLHRILRRILPAPLTYVEWEWLIAFGLLEAVRSWLQLLPFSPTHLQLIVSIISIFSLITLYQFWQCSNRYLLLSLIIGVILSTIAPDSFTIEQRLLIIRVTVGVTIIIAAFSIFAKYRNLQVNLLLKSLLLLVAFSLVVGLVLMPAIRFFSTEPNTRMNQAIAISLISAIDLLLWFQYGSLFENLGKLSKRQFNWLLILPFILVIVAGWFITETISNYTYIEIKNSLTESQITPTEIDLHLSVKEVRLLSISTVGLICLALLGLALRSRHHAEAVANLRAENRLHHAMFDINQAIKMLIDPDRGTIIDANPAACAFYGYTRSQMQSMNIAQINTLSPQEIKEEMQSAKSEQRSYFLFPHRLANGDIRLMEVYSGPLKLPGRQVLFSIMHDRTEEERQALALIERDQLLRKLSENIPGMIYQYLKPKNEAGKFPFVSDSALRLLGVSADALKENSKLAIKHIHPQDRRMVWQSILLSERTLKPWRCEFRVTIVGKTIEWRQGDAVPERLQNGDILWHGYLHNTTDRRTLEEELLHERKVAEESNRAKSRFLAHMSHEIRTPMNSILGFSSLLSDTRLTKEQHKYVQMVHQSGTSLLSLINDILDLSRIESGKIELSNQSIDLAELIRDATGLLRLKAEEKGVALILEVEDICYPFVISDELKLRQILLNLISNAIKFTDHGTVTVKVQRKENSSPLNLDTNLCHARFEIIDTGIGIKPEILVGRKLFEPFTQADATTTRKYGGSGLGLTITKELVEYMGGEIGAFNNSNQGATFWFEIPLAKGFDPKKRTQAISLEVPESLGYHILIVEDSIPNRLLVELILKKKNITSVSAIHGLDALSKLSSENFDAILMDIEMPEMDGLEATKRIRSGEVGQQNIPIIAMTAQAMEGDREKCLAVGMNNYISKPLDSNLLFQALYHLIGNHNIME